MRVLPDSIYDRPFEIQDRKIVWCDYPFPGGSMTPEEKAAIDVALEAVEHGRNHELGWYIPHPWGTDFLGVMHALRESRKPKPRYTTRPTGFGYAVWDTHEERFVPPHECAIMFNTPSGLPREAPPSGD